MITKNITVNGKNFRVIITEQIIQHVNNLKSLYNVSYEDSESFDHVSSEISNTINRIAETVEPHASDSDLDGVIQKIILITDTKTTELNKLKTRGRIKKRKSNIKYN